MKKSSQWILKTHLYFIINLFLFPFVAHAGSFYVSPQGSDSNAGSLTQPWRTLSFAQSRLNPGDTLFLRGGIYSERVHFSRSGLAGSPITYEGFSGETAIIHSGSPAFLTAGNNDWELVNANLGEYRSRTALPTPDTFNNRTIWGYIQGLPGYENENLVLVPYQDASQFRSLTDQYTNSSAPFYIGPGTFYDTDNRIHIRLSKTTDFRNTENRYGPLIPNENADPRNFSISLSGAYETIKITGSHLIFRNMTIHSSQNTIYLPNTVSDITFDSITAWMGDTAIQSSGAGTNQIRITNSRIYGDNPLYIFWSDMKNEPAPADLLRGTSINLNNGAHDWEISYSHIRGSGQDLIGVNDDEYNIRVHHNLMGSCGDDAFELEGTRNVGRIDIYENYVQNCLMALAPGQDTATFTGPLNVYRNVFSLLRNPPINRQAGINTWNGGGRYGFEYMFKQSGSSYATRNVHIYHNTLVMLGSSGSGLNLIPQNPVGSHIVNNLCLMVNGIVNNTYRTGATVNGNLYWKMNTVDTTRLLSSYDRVSDFAAATGMEQNGIGSVPRRGTDPQLSPFRLTFLDTSRTFWELPATSEVFRPWDFLLQDTSPARSAGINLSAFGLPDTRNSRDIGAYPFGTTRSDFNFFPFTQNSPPTSDTTPPVFSNILATSITNSGALINWSTNEAADSQVEYGLTSTYGSATPISTSLRTSHTHSLSDLANNATYHYRVKSKDGSGNLSTSQDFTFTTNEIAQQPKPTSTRHKKSTLINHSAGQDKAWFDYTSDVPHANKAKMEIYNRKGKILLTKTFEAGCYVEWDGASTDGPIMTSGTYFVVTTCGSNTFRDKVVIIR